MNRTIAVLILMLGVLLAPERARSTELLVDLSAQIPNGTDAAAFAISPGGVVVGSVRIDGGEQQLARWTQDGAEVLDSVFGSEYPQAVSDDGVVVGTYVGSGNGWFLREGTFDCIPLPDPCGSFNSLWRASSGNDLNASNEFTGAISPGIDQPISDPIEAYIGRFAADGSVHIERLGDFHGDDTRGFGINDHGEVVGTTGNGLDTTPLLFKDGDVIELPDVGGGYNWPEAINNAGWAVGIASRPDPGAWPYDAEAALWNTRAHPITVALLGRLDGHRLSRALDINNAGLAVGFSVDADFDDQRATAWSRGRIFDLNEALPVGSDWTLQVATGVNDDGLIVGYGRRDGIPGRRAFLLHPSELFASDFEADD